MISIVAEAIEASAFSDEDKAQLTMCLPMLHTTIGNSAMMQGGLTIAAATPKGGIMFNAKAGWPVLATTTTVQHDLKAMALAVYAAIESPIYKGDVILNSLTSMLGQAGVAAADDDLAMIADTGQAPIVVLLAVRTEQHITTMITTVGLAVRVLH
jgi:hypothetical protein